MESDGEVVAKHRRSDSGTRRAHGPFDIGSKEYNKHLVYRKANRLISAEGHWLQHPALHDDSELPPMSAREMDLLHIIYLLLARKGTDPRGVRQGWLLDQSIARRRFRGQILTQQALAGRVPKIPGLHIDPSDATREPCCPCICPRSRLFLNWLKRFATGAEKMQINGLFIGSCSRWAEFEDRVLSSAAGNAFSMTVACAHIAVAFSRLLQRAGLAVASFRGCDQTRDAGLPAMTLPGVATFYVDRLPLTGLSPAFRAAGVADVSLRFGTLCSGTDYVVLCARAVSNALSSRLPGLNLHVDHEFAAEICTNMQSFMAANIDPPAKAFYEDVLELPVGAMAKVDVLIFGSSCKSISFMNMSPHSLTDIDYNNRAFCSGNSLNGCLQYVITKQPKIVIIENVLGMLRAARGADASQGKKRNVDHVIGILEAHGYTCGFTKVDARRYLLPQTRARIWVWAELGGSDDARTQWPTWLANMCAEYSFPFESMLL